MKKSEFILALSLAAPANAVAQTNLTIYGDSLVNGWQDYGFSTIRNFANPSPVHSGNNSISVTVIGAWGAFQVYHVGITNSEFSTISFWLNGSASGGQQLQMYATLGTPPVIQNPRYILNAPLVNRWQQYSVPLSALGVANATNFTGFAIQDSIGSTQPAFFVDDIQLISTSAPAMTHLTVDAGQPIRTADARWFGMNTAVWENSMDTPQSITVLNNIGARALRFPGGSASDEYHFASNRQENNWLWAMSPANFIHVITNIDGEAITTLNYGTSSTNEAAAWVAYANASTANTQPLGVDTHGVDWSTAGYWASLRATAPLGTDDGRNFLRISRSAPLGFKYWEIGNECYGSWETDSNSVPHDPYTYALRARDYISLIKAVDPTVKVGVVVTPGEDSYANNTSHPVVNPRTGQTHNGWTPVMLATLASLHVTPDFLIEHRYAQNPPGEDDAGLLQSTSAWTSDAGSLRQQITDYVGSSGTNTELICTEHNSVSYNPGKQTTSVVNGLFFADSLAQLMQTEFNGLFWWDLREAKNYFNNNSPSLYGWRLYGDYGVVGGTDLYPPYYAAKLLRNFLQAGDTVISATSDYSLLSTYAARRLDGSLAMLTINKSPSNTATGQVAMAGFVPASDAAVYSYGIPQDEAARTSIGSPDIAQTSFSGAGTNFNYTFPPYSATVIVLAPAPAELLAMPVLPPGNEFVFQLQGQEGVPYVIQRSADLLSWTPDRTNTLAAGTLNITNSMDSSTPAQFWRAIWQP
jgi:hypothetical protein